METPSSYAPVLSTDLDALSADLEHRHAPAMKVRFTVGGKKFGCYPKRVRSGRGKKSTVRGFCRAIEQTASAPARRRAKRGRPSRSRAAVTRRNRSWQQRLFPFLKLP